MLNFELLLIKALSSYEYLFTWICELFRSFFLIIRITYVMLLFNKRSLMDRDSQTQSVRHVESLETISYHPVLIVGVVSIHPKINTRYPVHHLITR